MGSLKPGPTATVPPFIPIDATLMARASPALRTTSASTPPIRQLDFVTGVHGIQVPESATVIEWPGGLRTITPTLEQNNKNYLALDEAYVRCVASFPQAIPGSSYIDFLDLNSYEYAFDLIVDICKSPRCSSRLLEYWVF